MPRRLRDLASDVLALMLGFVVVSSLSATVIAARRPDGVARTQQTLSLIAPTDGQIVSGTITLAAQTGLDTDVLQFQVSGSNFGPPISAGPCSMTWNTTGTADGPYSVDVVGYDGNGAAASSASVTVTVENSAPQIAGVTVSGLTSTSAVVMWSTNQRSSSRLDYGVNGYSSSVPLDSRLVTQHALTVTGLAPGTPYRFRVASTNEIGLTGTSPDMSFTTVPGDVPIPPGGSGGTGGSGPGTALPSIPPPSTLPPTAPLPALPPAPPAPTPTPPATVPPATAPPSTAPPATAPPATAPPTNHTIEGTVLGPQGTPLAGIKVLLLRGTALVLTSTTDSAGRFRFTGVAPGSYTALAVTPSGAALRFFYNVPAN